MSKWITSNPPMTSRPWMLNLLIFSATLSTPTLSGVTLHATTKQVQFNAGDQHKRLCISKAKNHRHALSEMIMHMPKVPGGRLRGV